MEEMLTYAQVVDYITRDEQMDVVWKYRHITAHQGPLSPKHPDYRGSAFNVMIEWENGEITSEPMNVMLLMIR